VEGQVSIELFLIEVSQYGIEALNEAVTENLLALPGDKYSSSQYNREILRVIQNGGESF
jgi:hypothetical protein